MISAGCYFGEVALLHSCPRMATLTARTTAFLYTVRGPDLATLLEGFRAQVMLERRAAAREAAESSQ